MVKILKNKQSLFWAGLLFAQFLLFYIFSKNEIIVQQFTAFFHFKKEFQNELFLSFQIFFWGYFLYHFHLFPFIFSFQKH
jgi:hypothetical protein